jgi:hypothetical protein
MQGVTKNAVGFAVGLALAAGLAASCAGKSTETSGSPERVAQLEQRIARLEALLARPDAARSDPELPNAGAQSADEAARSQRYLDAGFLGSDASVPDPAAQEARCLQEIEQRCRAHSRAASPVNPGDKLSWTKIDQQPPSATAKGRECLARERRNCSSQADGTKRRTQVVAWLDAQLETKLDRAFSDAVTQRMRAARVPDGHPQAEARCTAQFCRLKPGGMSHHMSAVEESFTDASEFSSESFPHGGADYVTRPGYRFPVTK